MSRDTVQMSDPSEIGACRYDLHLRWRRPLRRRQMRRLLCAVNGYDFTEPGEPEIRANGENTRGDILLRFRQRIDAPQPRATG